jgi:hypothetical protein
VGCGDRSHRLLRTGELHRTPSSLGSSKSSPGNVLLSQALHTISLNAFYICYFLRARYQIFAGLTTGKPPRGIGELSKTCKEGRRQVCEVSALLIFGLV